MRRIALLCASLLVVGCVSDPVKPETRIQTNTVLVPTPVPCINAADVPALPAPTPVDVEHATTDQLAAAVAADAERFQAYAVAVSAMLAQCSRPTSK